MADAMTTAGAPGNVALPGGGRNVAVMDAADVGTASVNAGVRAIVEGGFAMSPQVVFRREQLDARGLPGRLRRSVPPRRGPCHCELLKEPICITSCCIVTMISVLSLLVPVLLQTLWSDLYRCRCCWGRCRGGGSCGLRLWLGSSVGAAAFLGRAVRLRSGPDTSFRPRADVPTEAQVATSRQGASNRPATLSGSCCGDGVGGVGVRLEVAVGTIGALAQGRDFGLVGLWRLPPGGWCRGAVTGMMMDSFSGKGVVAEGMSGCVVRRVVDCLVRLICSGAGPWSG